MGVQNLGCRAAERRTADQGTIKERTQRIEIGTPIQLVAVGALFRRHVDRRPNGAASAGEIRGIQCPCDPKVRQQRHHKLTQHSCPKSPRALRSGRLQQHIAGLDIAVHNPTRMGVAQRTRQGCQKCRTVVHGQSAMLFKKLGQAGPFDQRHDKIGRNPVLGNAYLQNGQNIGMVQLAVGARFLLEPLADHRVFI